MASHSAHTKSSSAEGDHRLKIDLDTQNMTLAAEEIQWLESEVGKLKPMLANFPVQILHIDLEYNQNSLQFEGRLALVLPKQTFATAGVDRNWQAIMEHAVRRMIRRLEHYKHDLSRVAQRQATAAGERAVVEPTRQVSGAEVQEAIQQNDYSGYRTAVSPYESSLHDRVGRWVQRTPEFQAMIGERLTISDIVEEVFMLSFDQFEDWRSDQWFGQWLEELVDPAIRTLVHGSEEDLEAVRFQQSWRETE